MKKDKYILSDDLIGPKDIERIYNLKPGKGREFIKKFNQDLRDRGKLFLPRFIPRELFADYIKSSKVGGNNHANI